MIATQLDLFGAAPKPPRKVKETPLPEARPEPEPADAATDADVEPAVAGAGIAAGEIVPGETTGAEPQPEQVIEHEQFRVRVRPKKTLPVQAVQNVTVVKTRGRKSAEELNASADLLNIPPDEELFKRQYYAMREVAAMFNLNQSLIRFWETEFDILQPKKNKKGDRYFRPMDIKNLVLIHNLLRVRKFTIEGAREFLQQNKKAVDNFELIQKLEKIKLFLQELKANL